MSLSAGAGLKIGDGLAIGTALIKGTGLSVNEAVAATESTPIPFYLRKYDLAAGALLHDAGAGRTDMVEVNGAAVSTGSITTDGTNDYLNMVRDDWADDLNILAYHGITFRVADLNYTTSAAIKAIFGAVTVGALGRLYFFMDTKMVAGSATATAGAVTAMLIGDDGGDLWTADVPASSFPSATSTDLAITIRALDDSGQITIGGSDVTTDVIREAAFDLAIGPADTEYYYGARNVSDAPTQPIAATTGPFSIQAGLEMYVPTLVSRPWVSGVDATIVRIPRFAAMDDGATVACACELRSSTSDEDVTEIAVKFSSDSGATWGAKVTIDAQSGTPSNPNITYDPATGELYCLYDFRSAGDTAAQIYAGTAVDPQKIYLAKLTSGGALDSVTDVTASITKPTGWRRIIVSPGIHHGGVIYWPICYSDASPNDTISQMHVVSYTISGGTWGSGTLITDDNLNGEACLARDPVSGDFVLITRNYNPSNLENAMGIVRSTDNGSTLSAVTDEPLLSQSTNGTFSGLDIDNSGRALVTMVGATRAGGTSAGRRINLLKRADYSAGALDWTDATNGYQPLRPGTAAYSLVRILNSSDDIGVTIEEGRGATQYGQITYRKYSKYAGTSYFAGNLPPLSHIVSYYPLDDATDAHADNTLTETGTISYAAGKVGNGAVLDGSTSRLEYATGIVSDLEKWSISVWVKHDTLTADQIVYEEAVPASGNLNILLYRDEVAAVGGNTDTYSILIWDTVNTTYRVEGDTDWSSDTGWHHLVATFEEGGNLRLYLDGVEAAAGATSLSGVTGLREAASGVDTYVGANRNTTPGQLLDGMVDELGLFDYVLSADEVTALYAADSGLAYTDLLQ